MVHGDDNVVDGIGLWLTLDPKFYKYEIKHRLLIMTPEYTVLPRWEWPISEGQPPEYRFSWLSMNCSLLRGGSGGCGGVGPSSVAWEGIHTATGWYSSTLEPGTCMQVLHDDLGNNRDTLGGIAVAYMHTDLSIDI